MTMLCGACSGDGAKPALPGFFRCEEHLEGRDKLIWESRSKPAAVQSKPGVMVTAASGTAHIDAHTLKALLPSLPGLSLAVTGAEFADGGITVTFLWGKA